MRTLKKLSSRLSLYIISVSILLFVVSFAIYFNYSSQIITNAAIEQSQNELKTLEVYIEGILSQIEISTKTTAYLIHQNLDHPENFKRILAGVIKNNNNIHTVTIAFEPHVYNDYGDKAIFYMSNNGEYKLERPGITEQYDYSMKDWYLIPKLKNDNYWLEPHPCSFTGKPISGFTVPIKNKQGEFVGIVDIDVPLEKITEFVNEFKPFPNAYSLMLSKNASYIAHTKGGNLHNHTFFTYNTDPKIVSIGKQMLEEHNGYKSFYKDGTEWCIFYKSLGNAEWTIATVIPQSDILADINEANTKFWIIISIVFILIFILHFSIIKKSLNPLREFSGAIKYISGGNFDAKLPKQGNSEEMILLRNSFLSMQKSLKKYMIEIQESAKERERIDSELQIASWIQSGMLPKIFPPHPKFTNVDLFATLTPAKEIGGDLYDFFTIDNKLYFALGDASGKGVPASLLMAVTSSLFRTIAHEKSDPSEILYRINNSISETNEAAMFITLFVGILDLETGDMQYSNAGHNPPVLFRNGKAEFIDASSNCPLGIVEGYKYKGGEMNLSTEDYFFVYSDGLTEAENPIREQYSDDRLIAFIDTLKAELCCKDFIHKIQASMDEFVNGAEQSDDTTMLVIKRKAIEDSSSILKREIVLKNSLEELRILNDFIGEIKTDLSLDQKQFINLKLCLEEIVSNIIMYAYSGIAESHINISFQKNNEEFVLIISDEGTAFDPTQSADPDVSLDAEEREIGGLGIFLVKTFMDEVKYERKDNTNVLTLRMNIK